MGWLHVCFTFFSVCIWLLFSRHFGNNYLPFLLCCHSVVWKINRVMILRITELGRDKKGREGGREIRKTEEFSHPLTVDFILSPQWLTSFLLGEKTNKRNRKMYALSLQCEQFLSYFDAFSSVSSLGMKDSLGPLKSLVVASAVNGVGHVVLCSMLRYGITGAAWATMASQVCCIIY